MNRVARQDLCLTEGLATSDVEIDLRVTLKGTRARQRQLDMSNEKGEERPASPRSQAGEKQLDTVLVWFRRDLRVADNPALTAALQAAKTVVCYPTLPL